MHPAVDQVLAPERADPPKTAPNSDEILVSWRALREYGITYSRVHLRRLVRKNQFPAPVSLSPNRIAFKLSQLREWMASRPTRLAVGGMHRRKGG